MKPAKSSIVAVRVNRFKKTDVEPPVDRHTKVGLILKETILGLRDAIIALDDILGRDEAEDSDVAAWEEMEVLDQQLLLETRLPELTRELPEPALFALNEAISHRLMLEGLPPEKLESHYKAAQAARAGIASMAAKATLENLGLAKLGDATVDFADWASLPYWTVDEAVALVLGKNPDVINLQSIAMLDTHSGFRRKYEHAHRRVLRAFQLTPNRAELGASPTDFVELLTNNDMHLPTELIDMLPPVVSAKNRSESDELGGKKTSFHRIVFYLAFKHGLSPDQKTVAAAVRRIMNNAELAGDRIDDQTVRESLKEAIHTMQGRFEKKGIRSR